MIAEVEAALNGHNLTSEHLVHTNLAAPQCACQQPKPQTSLPDGGVCFRCGGLTVRTGSCTTCTSCGESGGCG